MDQPTRIRLAAWLSGCLGTTVEPGRLRIDSPSGGGWSNDTWLVETGAASGPARVVVRLQPARRSMFPTYDLGRQLACLQTLASVPAVPTPAVLGADLAGAHLGRPAFVMEHVAGRVPADDRPSFAEAGWLAEASPAEQRRFHLGMLDALAELHAVEWDRATEASLRPVTRASGAADPNRAALEELEGIWHWDRGARWPARIDEGFAAARAEIPAARERCLLWGDARPANVVVAADGFEPIALLDWELATIGAPEHELTWLMEMNWLRMEGAGLERLPGFLADAEAAAYYEQRSGRRLANLGWYRFVAALRVAVLMHRYLRAMVHAGQLPADHKLLADTVASRRVASLMGAR